jgi:hypothetical protein
MFGEAYRRSLGHILVLSHSLPMMIGQHLADREFGMTSRKVPSIQCVPSQLVRMMESYAQRMSMGSGIGAGAGVLW